MNGLTLLALIGVACAIALAYRYGRMTGRRDAPPATVTLAMRASAIPASAPSSPAPPVPAAPPPAPARLVESPHAASPAGALAPSIASNASVAGEPAAIGAEKTRIIVAYEAETARLARRATDREAATYPLVEQAEERRSLFRALADARADAARFRAIVVDLENDAPPPILNDRAMPDDLKLIVGIGPALERMLQQLGVGTYRQIARWTEHDIDDMDGRLAEFPGRIRRDAWVTQARELHARKYGERP